MPIQILNRDITLLSCGAMVNPTDPVFSGSGGTDRAIHTAAGPALAEACAALPRLETGKTAVTEGFSLPCRYVIHTVGPVWRGGDSGEEQLLRNCYRGALEQAVGLGLESVAFPLISSGTFGFPRDRVLRIAVDEISDFLLKMEGDLLVTLCILDRNSYTLPDEEELSYYAERPRRQYATGVPLPPERRVVKADKTGTGTGRRPAAKRTDADLCEALRPIPDNCVLPDELCSIGSTSYSPDNVEESLADWIKAQDDRFSVMLLKLIDRKKMSDMECYKKANIDRRTFWKICNQEGYRPSKETVLAFAIALELDFNETSRLLNSVGLSLSNSSTFDRIVQFYICRGCHDVNEINAALVKYDLPGLGCIS